MSFRDSVDHSALGSSARLFASAGGSFRTSSRTPLDGILQVHPNVPLSAREIAGRDSLVDIEPPAPAVSVVSPDVHVQLVEPGADLIARRPAQEDPLPDVFGDPGVRQVNEIERPGRLVLPVIVRIFGHIVNPDSRRSAGQARTT